MNASVPGFLQPWRLQVRKENGDCYHETSSGTECWRWTSTLGSGSFGVVWKEECISTSSSSSVLVRAVKRISKQQTVFSQSSVRELKALITFSDISVPEYEKHFVRFLGWFDDRVDLYLAMEFIQHGNLQQHVEKGVLSDPEAASVTTQVAQALGYMHEKNFIHRDIKPMNILVCQPGPQWHVKVADFGISKHIDGTSAGTFGIGTPGYMAPELFDRSNYSSAVDVWALGAVACCMRTGSPPFRSQTQVLDYARSQTPFPVEALRALSWFCGSFVQSAMARQPESRPSIEQVLSLDWLAPYTPSTPRYFPSLDLLPEKLYLYERSSVLTIFYVVTRLEVNTPRETTMTADSWNIEPRNDWEDTYDNASNAGKGTDRQSDPMATIRALPIRHLQRTSSSAEPGTPILDRKDKEREAGEAKKHQKRIKNKENGIKPEQENEPAADLMPNGRGKSPSLLASGSRDCTIKIWDPATDQCVSTLEGHKGPVLSVAWSYNTAQLASSSWDKTVKLWDPITGQCISTLKGHSDIVYSVAWSNNTARLASSSGDRTVKIWDPATGQCISTLMGHSETVFSVAWSPNAARLASGSWDNTAKIWDTTTGLCVSTLEGQSFAVMSVVWSHNGNRLATGSVDNYIIIWDSATGQRMLTLEGHGSYVYSLAWSDDDSRLASPSWGTPVKIWDLATGQCISTLEGHSDHVESLAWSHDMGWLASGSWDTTIKIWDPATGRCISTLEGHSDEVFSVAWLCR